MIKNRLINMRREIEIILEKYKNEEISKVKAINEILTLSIIDSNDTEICPICEQTVLINGVCPKCTIDLYSPLETLIIL